MGGEIETSKGSLLSWLRDSPVVFAILSATSILGLLFAVYTYVSSFASIRMMYSEHCDPVIGSGSDTNSSIPLRLVLESGTTRQVPIVFFCDVKIWNGGNVELQASHLLRDIEVVVGGGVLSTGITYVGAQPGKHLDVSTSSTGSVVKLVSLFPNSGIRLQYFSESSLAFEILGSYVDRNGKVRTVERFRPLEDVFRGAFWLLASMTFVSALLGSLAYETYKNRGVSGLARLLMARRFFLGRAFVVAFFFTQAAYLFALASQSWDHAPF